MCTTQIVNLYLFPPAMHINVSLFTTGCDPRENFSPSLREWVAGCLVYYIGSRYVVPDRKFHNPDPEYGRILSSLEMLICGIWGSKFAKCSARFNLYHNRPALMSLQLKKQRETKISFIPATPVFRSCYLRIGELIIAISD